MKSVTFSLVLYYLYALKRNKARLIDIVIWPILELLMFGFLGMSFQTHDIPTEKAILLFLTGLLFWYIFSRTTAEIVLQLSDDAMSRNLSNILVSPVGLLRLQIALISASFIKVFLQLFVLLGVSWTLYHLNLFTIGPMVVVYSTIFLSWGISLGLFVAGLYFLYGPRVIIFSWAIAGMIQPFSLVFYSRDILPPFAVFVSYLIPLSYLFESIRSQLAHGVIDVRGIVIASLITVTSFLASLLFFNIAYHHSRKTGMIARL